MGSLGVYSKKQKVEMKKFSCGSENASNAIPVCCLLSTTYLRVLVQQRRKSAGSELKSESSYINRFTHE